MGFPDLSGAFGGGFTSSTSASTNTGPVSFGGLNIGTGAGAGQGIGAPSQAPLSSGAAQASPLIWVAVLGLGFFALRKRGRG